MRMRQRGDTIHNSTPLINCLRLVIMFSFLNAGQGATVCLVNSLFAKFYMTIFWRFKMVYMLNMQT